MDLATINWEDELQRVILAFDIAQPCEIRHDDNEVYLQGTGHSVERRGEFRIKSGFRASASYQPEFRTFSIIALDEEDEALHSITFFIAWDGSRNRASSYGLLSDTSELKTQLAKSLYFLDLLTPEVEIALEAGVSAHEKLEWHFEFEARTIAR